MARPTAQVRLMGLLLAVTIATAPGCATVFRDHVESVEITTFPEGAVVAVDGVVQGKSPIVLRFQRDSTSPWVGVWLEGHEAEYLQLVRVFDGDGIAFLVMDVLLVPALTGLVGMWIALGVDFGGENFCGFERHSHHLNLKPAGPNSTPPPWSTRKIGEPPPKPKDVKPLTRPLPRRRL